MHDAAFSVSILIYFSHKINQASGNIKNNLIARKGLLRNTEELSQFAEMRANSVRKFICSNKLTNLVSRQCHVSSLDEISGHELCS